MKPQHELVRSTAVKFALMSLGNLLCVLGVWLWVHPLRNPTELLSQPLALILVGAVVMQRAWQLPPRRAAQAAR